MSSCPSPLPPAAPASAAVALPPAMALPGPGEGREVALSPADAARAERARRARINGAKSRGPVTEAGKARSSRNALKHGLTAEVHLVLQGENAAAFDTLARSLFAELAPVGTLDGALVAHLAAALWKTGRAERLEAQAFARGANPNPERLRLALRYQGQNRLALFRCLQELKDLRRRPLPSPPRDGAAASSLPSLPAESQPEDLPPPPADASGQADPPSPAPSADLGGHDDPATPTLSSPPPPPDLSTLALVVWGGARPCTPPPGSLMPWPTPGIPPQHACCLQDEARPADAPVAVDARGRIHVPPECLHDRGLLPEPPALPVEPAASALRHGLTLAALAADAADPATPPPDARPAPGVAPPTDAPVRNEPSRPEQPAPAAEAAGAAPPTVDTAWCRLWGIAPPPPDPRTGAAPPDDPGRNPAARDQRGEDADRHDAGHPPEHHLEDRPAQADDRCRTSPPRRAGRHLRRHVLEALSNRVGSAFHASCSSRDGARVVAAPCPRRQSAR
ncbi:hypothetical protein [Benzoatithermus flavus]